MNVVRSFLEKAAVDGALRGEVLRAQCEAVARVARSHGFDFSAQEYLDAAASLDDGELDAVVGGAGESRYANQETGYLLGRLETHKGLVTLTSNLSGTPTAEGTKGSTKP